MTDNGIDDLERKIITEIKKQTGRKIMLPQLQEFSTCREVVESNLQANEEIIECPDLGLWCAVKKPE